ncbi:MAG: twin-arginine translocase TatA/TatE family subunit [Acidimicrobiales bacterium]|jgi:Sec-independent protein translocase protein TatA
MGGLDPAKIFLILVIALIVVGPERLPGAARQLGGAWRELNRLRLKFEQEVRSAVPNLDLPKIPTNPSRAVTGYLTNLVTGQGDGKAATGPNAADIPRRDAAGAPGPGYLGDSPVSVPLLGVLDPSAARSVPAVPSWTSAGSLATDAIFVFDEPSMN